MKNLNRKELNVYRELAEHVGIILAKRWMNLSKADQSEIAQTASEASSNKKTKPNTNGTRKVRGQGSQLMRH